MLYCSIYLWVDFTDWRSLLTLQYLLAPGGRFYLVAVAQNKPDEICERMRQYGLECKVSLVCCVSV
jgi:tRNA1(Val) A37 N6-methylase TrmN6